jgi:uncharacterized membrane protein
MLSCNNQDRHAKKRAESDFEVNIRAEKEIEVILLHLTHQNELILKILEHIEQEKIAD